jgi:hypothetical protein
VERHNEELGDEKTEQQFEERMPVDDSGGDEERCRQNFQNADAPMKELMEMGKFQREFNNNK